MANQGARERLAWKDRIDQSPWVDGSQWVADDADGESIEFLEAEPSAYRLSETAKEPTQATSSGPSAGLLVAGAVGVVLVALAIMSRPSDQDPFEQLPPDRQQEIRQRQAGPEGALDDLVGADDPVEGEQDPADETDEAAGDTSGDTAVPGPFQSSDGETAQGAGGSGSGTLASGPPEIPPLSENLPAELPGRIITYGTAGTLVVVERAVPVPEERELDDLEPGADGSIVTIGADLVLMAGGTAQIIDPQGRIVGGETAADLILPADEGAVVVDDQGREVIAQLIGGGTASAPATGETDTEQTGWTFGEDAELLGAWRERLLVYKAGAVWLVDRDGGSAKLTDGQLLGYDGTNLAMVRCSGVRSCRIEVGPPSEPARRSIAVPERLAGRDLDSWTQVAAITADGSRLGLIDRRVSVPLPMWIDMETGESRSRSETINDGSAVAWSPDGQWLAYVFSDDLIVWNIELDRSWRIVLDRPIGLIEWVAVPEGEEAVTAEGGDGAGNTDNS